VTLGFVHDGLSAMELYADGQLIARRNGQFARVATVGPGGVAIGNTSTGDGFLNGEIDEVKIWRLNPHRVDEEFFSRPVDSETAECWARFFRSLAAALDRYPDCAQLLQRLIPEMVERLRRAIVAKGPETRERFDRASAEYRQLWRAGAIDGPDMAKLIGDWWAWLQLVGISIENDPGLAELHASECMRRLLAEVEAPDCDRQMVDLLQRLMASVGQQSRGERSRA
jgi:hypothetical protein